MDGNCFDAFLARCTPFRLPPPWDIFADPRAFLGPPDPAASLEELAATYPEQVLIQAGIAQRGATGTLQVHPFLQSPRTALVALRDVQTGAVNNLMTDAGCVTGYRYPLFASLFDKHSFQAIERGYRELILTGPLADAILLRSLGFAAAPVTGITDLDNYGVQLLGRMFGLKRRSSDNGTSTSAPSNLKRPQSVNGDEVYPPLGLFALPGCHRPGSEDNFVTLNVARWSPTTLSLTEPRAVGEALAFIKDLQTFLDVEVFDVNYWMPTQHDAKGISFGLRRGEPDWVRKTMLNSLENSSRGLIHSERESLDLDTARGRMQAAFTQDRGSYDAPERCKKAAAAFQEAVHRELILPMIQQTQKTSDPFERALQIQFTDLFELCSKRMNAVREQMFASKLTSRYPEDDGKEQLRDMLAISKQLLAYANKVLPCQNRKPAPKIAKPLTKARSRRFAGWGSPKRN